MCFLCFRVQCHRNAVKCCVLVAPEIFSKTTVKKRFEGYDEFTSLTLVEVSLFSSHSVIFK